MKKFNPYDVRLEQVWFLQTRNCTTEPESVYYMFGRFYRTVEEAQKERDQIAVEHPEAPIRVAMEWVHPEMAAKCFKDTA